MKIIDEITGLFNKELTYRCWMCGESNNSASIFLWHLKLCSLKQRSVFECAAPIAAKYCVESRATTK